MARKAKPPEPPCYDCIHAIKRGNFRLCSKGLEGYKHIGEWKYCSEQIKNEDVE